MLQFIRDNAQGWIAWVIVGLIIIPFALWGLNEYVGAGTEIAAAEVNGQDISQKQLQESYSRQRQRLQQMFGGQLPEELFSEASLKKQLLQQLIEDMVVLQSSSASKMRVGNNQLVATIHSIDAFKEKGQFSNTLYERVLRTQGMTAGSFELRLRRDLMLQQYMGGIEGSEFITSTESNLVAALQRQKRHINYITVPASKFMNSESVSEDDIVSYFNANQDKYRTPEMVKASYVELKQDVIAAEITIDESLLKERYESQILNYKTAEERRARHILLTDDDDAKAKQKAEAALARISAGESFEKLAKELSQDPGSAAQGGDLGFFGRGLMDKAFEDEAYRLKIGEVSPIVKSEFGYHIIKLEEVRGGKTKSFAEVRGDILKEVQQERAEKRFYDQAEMLANLTYEQPDTLQAVADELKLKIQQTPLFDKKGGQGISKNAKFAQAAFSEDVLQRGNNSEVIELTKDHLVVLRIESHQLEGVQPLDAVKNEIKTEISKNRAETNAKTYADSLLEKITGGEKPEVISKKEKLQWHEATVQRDTKDLERTILSEAFKMAHPKSGETTRRLVKTANGDQVLITLNFVEAAFLQDSPVSKEEIKSLRDGYSTAGYRAIIDKLRKDSDITINQ